MRAVPLVSCDAADAARHIAVLLRDAASPPATGLLIATDPRPALRQLRRHLPRVRWQGREFAADTPVDTASRFDAVVVLDAVALLPRERRAALVQAAFGLARRDLVVAAPLGTDLHLLIDTSLARFHCDLLGVDHPHLAAHLRHGLPMPDEALTWAALGDAADLGFAGDVLAYRHRAERLIRSRRLGFPRGLLLHLFPHLLPEPERLDLTLETVPMRRHRRLYLHMRRT